MTKTILTLALDDTAALAAIASQLPGAHLLNKTEIEGGTVAFDFSEGANSAELPLTAEKAELLMDRDGYVTVLLILDRENYFGYVIASASNGQTTPEDYAHAAAFSFGIPNDCTAEIVGVAGTDFIVSYTTHVREFLDA